MAAKPMWIVSEGEGVTAPAAFHDMFGQGLLSTRTLDPGHA